MGTEGDYSPQALEKLQFRRQFFLGPEFITGFPAWTRIQVGTEHCLTVHPDLEFYQATNKNKSITLLGFILDPNNPEASNADVVEALIRKFDRCDDFWKYTGELGGRWVLIVNDGQDIILFQDAAGLRSLYYSQSSPSKQTYCASQPGLIAKTLNLAMDKEALGYVNSREPYDYEVYWLPGDATMYADIKALLPNHYVSLCTGQSQRFWPDADVKGLSRQEAVVESSRLLHGLMLSARRRFDLALSLTAGWDSRVMLALSRDMVRDLYCFTLTYPHTENTRDVTIPAALLKKLGLKHSLIQYPEHVNAAYKDIYQSSIDAATTAYCADAQAMHDCYPQNRVCITGDVAEIFKCYYRLAKPKGTDVSARDLAQLCGIGTHPFLIRAFEKWLSTAEPHNVHLLDLFCWEQIAGRKQALIRAQYDIAHESFSPFNCRSLLATMLSADEDYRRPPEYKILTELMQQVWPEVLSVPINPPEKIRMKNFLIPMLQKLRVYELVPDSAKSLGRRILK